MAGLRCSVCEHEMLAKIDADLALDKSTQSAIARKYSVSRDAIYRHQRDHLSTKLIKAHDAIVVAQADTLLDKLLGLQDDARRIATAAEDKGDLRTALQGVRELTRICELQAKMAGEIQNQTVVNIAVLPEWVGLRAKIVAALEPFPEAKKAVLEAISE